MSSFSSSQIVLIALALVAATLLAVAKAAPQAEGARGYLFPDSAESMLIDPLDTSFTCEGLAYGFYADVNNNCQIFHVCQPVVNEIGEEVDYNQWSFICGNQTVFDQLTLSCNHFEDASPCQDAPEYYNQIEYGLKLDQE